METAQVEAPDSASRLGSHIVAIVGGIGVVALLVAIGFVFATSSSAEQVAQSARSLHVANATAGSAALSRAAVAQATVFTIDYGLGVASLEARDIALEAAAMSLEDTSHWAETLSFADGMGTLGEELEGLSTIGKTIVALLASDRIVEAEELRDSTFEPRYAATAESLAASQMSTVGEIRRTERSAGIVASLSRLLATLLIPAIAIIIYFLFIRKQLREAKLKMDSELKAQREVGKAKDDFIASISHELRTPLTSIYGFSEYLVETETLDPDEAIELVALINEDSVELSRMVDDLLTAARVGSDALKFDYQHVDLRVETAAATGAMARSGTTVQIMGDVLCWADPTRVRQIVRNLVSNAIKHGGPMVDVHLESDGDRAVLTVSDNGEALDPELEARMFDRFVHDGVETLLTGSVGLGLSIARSLARTMGGDIRFARADGWTNFEVSLPRKEEVPIEVPPAARKPIVTDGPFAERVLAPY
jgi:signal transduction histidine kinase